MTLQEVKPIATEIFKGYQIDNISEKSNYFIVALKNVPLDGLHMINKQTGEIMPYDPHLLKGKTK